MFGLAQACHIIAILISSFFAKVWYQGPISRSSKIFRLQVASFTASCIACWVEKIVGESTMFRFSFGTIAKDTQKNRKLSSLDVSDLSISSNGSSFIQIKCKVDKNYSIWPETGQKISKNLKSYRKLYHINIFNSIKLFLLEVSKRFSYF